ncbi:MAG: NAD(P)/FAD-dependent oxidoreductase [Oscillospiraceae bacterium]|nr:NAD(P)/FAD-dependent oxidoreductase [Oscillospiraceae bacterium]
MYDTLIIGGGVAGVSAALTLRQRQKRCAILSGDASESAIWPAARIDNYPGLPGIDGQEFMARLLKQLAESGAELIHGRASSILPLGESFGVAAGSDFFEAKSLILCTGVSRSGAYAGERELLGRGVSYCVTCDGMLYRGKRTAVIGLTAEAEREAKLLSDMGCEVRLFTKRKKYVIIGEDKVRALKTGDEEWPCEAVFILRAASLPDALLPGLSMERAHIAVDRQMCTSIPGVFAAGDCCGEPYQLAKAAGEGNTAALSACRYLER